MNTIKLSLTATVISPEGAETTISRVVNLPPGADHVHVMSECVELTGATFGEDIGPFYGFERVPEGGYWLA